MAERGDLADIPDQGPWEDDDSSDDSSDETPEESPEH